MAHLPLSPPGPPPTDGSGVVVGGAVAALVLLAAVGSFFEGGGWGLVLGFLAGHPVAYKTARGLAFLSAVAVAAAADSFGGLFFLTDRGVPRYAAVGVAVPMAAVALLPAYFLALLAATLFVRTFVAPIVEFVRLAACRAGAAVAWAVPRRPPPTPPGDDRSREREAEREAERARADAKRRADAWARCEAFYLLNAAAVEPHFGRSRFD